LEEAWKGVGRTSPNPLVGAVLVRGPRLLAKGYHRRAGFPHAEIEVLEKVKNPKGATLYVTLEPCCHKEKRTPPCVGAIIASGISRVVIGTLDPNPLVSGRGIRQLKKAKIKTQVGLLKEECRDLNRFYNHWIKTKTPYVILKAASSLDGRIALSNGKSKWITSPASRRRAHQIRSQVDAILVGVGTVLADNPRLSARAKKNSPQPLKIVLDPNLRISERAKVFSGDEKAHCLIIMSPTQLNKPKAKRLKGRGIQLLDYPYKKPQGFKLKNLMKALGNQGVTSLLLEGGPGVWTSFLKQKTVHEILHFLAPTFLGQDAKPLIQKLGLKNLRSGPKFSLKGVERSGPDLVIRYAPVK